MHKKNLDKLFQEALKDLSKEPDEKVWHSIEASLDKKKKSRRIIPIWWKLGGVAALLFIGIWVFAPFEEPANSTPAVTNTQELQEDSPNSEKNTDIIHTYDRDSNSSLVNTDKKSNKNIVDIETTSTPQTKDRGNNLLKKKNSVHFQKSENSIAVGAAVSKTKPFNLNEIQNENNDDGSIIKIDRPGVTQTKENAHNTNDEKNFEKPDFTPAQKNLFNSNEVSPEKDAIVKNEEKEQEVTPGNEGKKSIFDEIAEQNSEEEIAESRGEKWSAGPSIAPVFFDAIGQGSPVHSSFVPNSKSGDLNFSYGLSIAYEISKKLSVRSGVHRVGFGYDTNEIEFSSALESSDNGRIANINYAANSENLVVVSSATPIENVTNEGFASSPPDVIALATASQNGVMSQQFGYLEVPLELQYALLDKKFGVNLIGGVSSLFLVDNSISLTSGNLTTEMGEANNVNAVNFSTNVGIGVNYKFTPKIRLNVEPVFKYQLNTFSQTDGTFRPFSVGVYSGVNFKF